MNLNQGDGMATKDQEAMEQSQQSKRTFSESFMQKALQIPLYQTVSHSAAAIPPDQLVSLVEVLTDQLNDCQTEMYKLMLERENAWSEFLAGRVKEHNSMVKEFNAPKKK